VLQLHTEVTVDRAQMEPKLTKKKTKLLRKLKGHDLPESEREEITLQIEDIESILKSLVGDAAP